MNEARKQRVKDYTQLAAIIMALLDKCKVSEEFLSIKHDEKFFNDSCEVVELRSQLQRLATTLESNVYYTNLLHEIEYGESIS